MNTSPINATSAVLSIVLGSFAVGSPSPALGQAPMEPVSSSRIEARHASAAEVAAWDQRDLASQGLEEFEGGEPVIIVGGSLLTIAVVVLIVVLLLD
jgi:hypothetical protein